MSTLSSGGSALAPEPLIPYVPAVQHFLGRSRSSADRMAAAGEISVFKIGRRLFTKESEVRRYIAAVEAATARGQGRV